MDSNPEDKLRSILMGKEFPDPRTLKHAKPPRKRTIVGRIPSKPYVPEPKPPASFDATAHKILRSHNLTKKQFNRYMEQLTYYILTRTSAEYARSMFDGIARGDSRCMNSFEKIFGMIKGGDGLVVNLNQNNLSVNAGNGGRDFDALLREIDQADRSAGAIEASAEVVEEAGDGVE